MDESVVSSYARPIPFFICFALFFLALFSFSLTLMAGPYIVSDLGGSNQLAIYAAAFFGVGNALGIPLGKHLLYSVGCIRLLVICLCFYAFFSITAAFSPDYAGFLSSRLLEGVAAGPLYIIVLHLFEKITPHHKKHRFDAISFGIFATAPVIGVCWGGWIAYDYDWRYLFYANGIMAIFLMGLICIHFLGYDRENKAPNPPLPFNWTGWISYAVGIVPIAVVLVTGQEFDWFRSYNLIYLAAIGLVSLVFYILWDLRHPNPILDLHLLRKIPFTFVILCISTLFSIYFGVVTMLSLWLTLYANYTPIWLAAIFATMVAAGLFSIFVVQRRFGHTDPRIPLALSILCLGVSCFYTTIFNIEIDIGRVIFSRLLAGFGLTLFIPSLRKICFLCYPKGKNDEVNILFHVTRVLSSGVGAAVFQIIWQRREVFFHSRLGGGLTAFSAETQAFFARAKQFNLTGLQADAQLDVFLQQQSFALALDDTFYLMGWMMVGLFGLLLLSFLFKGYRSVTI